MALKDAVICYGVLSCMLLRYERLDVRVVSRSLHPAGNPLPTVPCQAVFRDLSTYRSLRIVSRFFTENDSCNYDPQVPFVVGMDITGSYSLFCRTLHAPCSPTQMVFELSVARLPLGQTRRKGLARQTGGWKRRSWRFGARRPLRRRTSDCSFSTTTKCKGGRASCA